MSEAKIRNFSIIAHIDHGKSTLADRMLELTGVVDTRQMQEQILDNMELERERGITIKARAVSIPYKYKGEEYILNLIDTPGHVDFTYEVSRSLYACEGALMLVDASQGIEAQTVANMYLALEADLEIIPVINKIDLANAITEQVIEEIVAQFGNSPDEIMLVSAKTGQGVKELLDAIIERIPPPKGKPDAPLRALIFDAVYDDYRGVIVFIRVIDGTIAPGMKIEMCATNTRYEVHEVGTFSAVAMNKADKLSAGSVGYVIANIKRLSDVKVGDTIKLQKSDVEPLPGFKNPQPVVYCGLYPTYNKDYDLLRKALEKLALNDSSFTFEPENSEALGFGFRCGFLGLLHMEIVQERLERESGVELVQTAPNVTYEILKKNGEILKVYSPADVPDPSEIQEFREPFIKLQMILPSDSIGAIMKLCEERRGKYVMQEYLSKDRVILTYEMPLAEILFDFYDMLTSGTHGYGTMDYDFIGYRASDLIKLQILINKVPVDALSVIMHRENAERKGRRMLIKLRREIPRHLFEIPLQAAIGGKVIARETIKPLRKDVLAKCYGGDVSRKHKLLEKQKAGKKRMKQVGNVEIPQKAFLTVLKIDKE